MTEDERAAVQESVRDWPPLPAEVAHAVARMIRDDFEVLRGAA